MTDTTGGASLYDRRRPQNAVGKTIREIHEYGWRVEIVFTDDTKIQIEPGGIDEEEGGEFQPELIFQERLDAD